MPRDLDLTFDISTGALTLDRVVGNYVKRSETLTLSVTIVSNGASATIPAGLVGTLKPVNTYGTTLAQWTTFSQVGATNVYTASTTINAAAVTTLLGTTTEQANCVFDFAGAGVVESDTLALVLKNNVTRDDDTAPTALLNRNDFLVTNGTGLLVNVAAGYAANGAFVAAQASLAITNATNYIEVTAAGVASVNTTAFSAGSYPLATVVASAGAITANTDLRAWITPKPAAAGGVTSITGTANEITVTGTTTPTLSLPSALTFTAKTVTGGTFASPTFTTPALGTPASGDFSTGAFTWPTFDQNTTGSAGSAATLTTTRTIGGANFNGSEDVTSFPSPGAIGGTTPNTIAGTTGTFSGDLITTGTSAQIYTSGAAAYLATYGAAAHIYTDGANAQIYTSGTFASISTGGSSAHISTGGSGAYIQTRSTFRLNGGTYVTTLSHAATANRAIALPDDSGTLALTSDITGGTLAGSFTTLTASSTSSLLLGTAGSAVGNVGFRNATSGTTTLAPATGALGTGTVTLPLSGTLAISSGAQTFTGVQSMTSPNITTSITTPSTTFALVNATATTVNFAGAATTLNIGAPSAAITLGANSTLNGGSAANDDITIQGTSNATRASSYVLLQPNGGYVGIGATPTTALTVISDVTGGRVAYFKTTAASNGNTQFVLDTATNTNCGLVLEENATDKFGVFYNSNTTSGSRVADTFEVYSFVSSAPILRLHQSAPLAIAVASDGGVSLPITLAVTGASTLTGLLTANGGITLGDAQNIAFNTTTGTKIGAATTQKLSFWNATPIVQPTTAVASATVASPGGGVNLKTDDTFDGYTIAQVVKALRNAGLLA
jgi:hypothetical protein